MNKANFTKVNMVLMGCFLLWSLTARAQLVDSTVPVFHWAKNWGMYSGVDAIGTDGQGNVICAGLFSNAADFDPGPGEFILTPGMEGLAGNAYISKFDSAGNFIWAKKIEPDPNTPAVWDMYAIMGINSIAVSKRGNIYLVATFYGAMDLDPGQDVYTVSPSNDIDAFGEWWPSTFVVKLDANGLFQWGHKIDNYNGSNMSVGIWESGDVEELYFTGDYTQLTTPESGYTLTFEIDYDPGPEEYMVGGDSLLYNNTYGYLMKWSSAGEFQWFRRIARGAGNGGLGVYGVSPPSIDADKNVYVAGHFYGVMDVDPSEETYLAWSVDTLPSEATTSGVARELYVAKYDANGELVWFHSSDSQPMVDAGMYYYPEIWNASVGIDAESNVYVAPIFRGNMNLDRSVPLGGAATFETYFNPFPQMGEYLPNYPASAIMKYNGAGEFQWAKLLDNSENSGVKSDKIVVSPEGEIYIHGMYRSSIDFDPGVDTHIVHGEDIGPHNQMPYRFLAKYDRDGNYLWASRINKAIPIQDSIAFENIHNMVLDNQDNIIYGGMLFDLNGMDVDPGDAEFVLTSLEGLGDGYLVKLRLNTTYTDTTTVDTTTAIQAFAQVLDLKVFPNPNRGQLQVKSSKALHNAALLLFDVTGRMVLEQTGLNGTDFSCDLSALPGGTYMLRLTEGANSATYKLVKQE